MVDSEILNETDFNEILHNFTNNNRNVKYISSKLVSSDGVEGFMGEYFMLEINYEESNNDKIEKFFVKVLPTLNDYQEKVSKERNLYNKEIFFLNFLLKEYEKCGINTSFAPKCFLAKDKKIIVMEHLINNDYAISKRNRHYDMDEIKAGLEALALYHASSIVYEEIQSKEQAKKFRLETEYPGIFSENYYNAKFNYTNLLIANTTRIIKFAVNELRAEKPYAPEFETFLTIDNILFSFVNSRNFRKAIGHGDLWYSNIFFRYLNSKAVKCKLVDFQVLRYFYPVYDVLLFVHLNTSRKFRLEHLTILLRFYHDKLGSELDKHGIDVGTILSWDEFCSSKSFVSFTAMFNVISMGVLVFMSQENLNELHSKLGDSIFDIVFELSCTCFKNETSWYRMQLADAVNDLYDSFCTR